MVLGLGVEIEDEGKHNKIELNNGRTLQKTFLRMCHEPVLTIRSQCTTSPEKRRNLTDATSARRSRSSSTVQTH